MEAKHTPGPWAVWPHLDSYHIRGQEKDIAFTRPATETHMGKEEQANARLIAAAPDLLAALEELVQASYDSVNGKQYAPYHVEELGRATVAIAKARGGE